MADAKLVGTPLGRHFKLTNDQSPKAKHERDIMAKVSYASAIASLMYAMVCTRPDIAQAAGIVESFHKQSGEATLGKCKIDSHVSEGNHIQRSCTC